MSQEGERKRNGNFNFGSLSLLFTPSTCSHSYVCKSSNLENFARFGHLPCVRGGDSVALRRLLLVVFYAHHLRTHTCFCRGHLWRRYNDSTTVRVVEIFSHCQGSRLYYHTIKMKFAKAAFLLLASAASTSAFAPARK